MNDAGPAPNREQRGVAFKIVAKTQGVDVTIRHVDLCHQLVTAGVGQLDQQDLIRRGDGGQMSDSERTCGCRSSTLR